MLLTRKHLYAKICWSTVFLEDLCIPGNGWHRWLPYYVQHWERSDGISASRRRLAACVTANQTCTVNCKDHMQVLDTDIVHDLVKSTL